MIDPRSVDLQVVAACMREFTCVARYIYIFATLYSKLIHAARAGGGGSLTAKAAAAAAAACASSAKARLPVCLGSILARPGRPEKKISAAGRPAWRMMLGPAAASTITSVVGRGNN